LAISHKSNKDEWRKLDWLFLFFLDSKIKIRINFVLIIQQTLNHLSILKNITF
jgi:hypothetical protein